MHDFLVNIQADAYRYGGNSSLIGCLKIYFRVPGYRFMFWHRLAHLTRVSGKVFYLVPWLVLSRLKYKFGLDIPAETLIGPGFYIGHFGGVVISAKSKIGKNCNISQGVTIGYNPRGSKAGYPVIGDRVYIAPGAKIIGKVNIGNDAVIGANAVVVDDVPEFGVAAGIPAKVISMKGSTGYILNKIEG